MGRTEPWQLVGSVSPADTETEATDAGSSGPRRPRATMAAVLATLSLGIFFGVFGAGGIVGIFHTPGFEVGEATESVAKVLPVSEQGLLRSGDALPDGDTTWSRSRTGCANWRSIALTLPALRGHTQDSCDRMCSGTPGCFYSNFQPDECQNGDEGETAGACYLLGPGCELKANNCWDLHVAPGPPAFKLEKSRTGCSNWVGISIKAYTYVDNMFRCSVECSQVNCSRFNFAPENGSCHLFQGACVEVENTAHDLYKVIPTVTKYAWVTSPSEPPHHHVPVNDVSGFPRGTTFTMLYPDMRAVHDRVIQSAKGTPKGKELAVIMFAPALTCAAYEGTLVYSVQSGSPMPAPTPAPTSTTAAPTSTPEPTFTPTPAPTACWLGGTEVRIVPGSRYDDGSTGGTCATIGSEPVCSDKQMHALTWGNGFSDVYLYGDIEPYVCPTAAPTEAPTAAPTEAPTPAPTRVVRGIFHSVTEESLGLTCRSVYSQPYNDNTMYDDIFGSNHSDDELILVGAKPSSSSSEYTVVAVDTIAEVKPLTNTTSSAHGRDGLYWYNWYGYSFGFSPQASVLLYTCDISNKDINDCASRLCWHTDGMHGGYRAGCTTKLNSNGVWWKVVKYCVADLQLHDGFASQEKKDEQVQADIKHNKDMGAAALKTGKWVAALDHDLKTQMLVQADASASLPEIKDPCGSVTCGSLQCPGAFKAESLPGHCCPYCVNPDIKLESVLTGASGASDGKASVFCANVWCFPTMCTKAETEPSTTNGLCCATCPAL